MVWPLSEPNLAPARAHRRAARACCGVAPLVLLPGSADVGSRFCSHGRSSRADSLGQRRSHFFSLESREGCRVNRRPSHQRLTSERSFEMRRLRSTEARENSPPLAKSANWRLAKCRIVPPEQLRCDAPHTLDRVFERAKIRDLVQGHEGTSSTSRSTMALCPWSTRIQTSSPRSGWRMYATSSFAAASRQQGPACSAGAA